VEVVVYNYLSEKDEDEEANVEADARVDDIDQELEDTVDVEVAEVDVEAESI
jgi:hypothetical protein